jgi:DNA-directed RNA polymerase specialized sigma24 family protein
MVPRRSMNQRRAILEMHERGNSYSEISVVLGIPRSTCNDIVRRFGVKGDLRNRHSHGRP